MNKYILSAVLFVIFSAILIWIFTRKQPVSRDELEFKFRTGQITHEEMIELEALRAADRVGE